MALKCKECGLEFFSTEGLELHVGKARRKIDPKMLDSFS